MYYTCFVGDKIKEKRKEKKLTTTTTLWKSVLLLLDSWEFWAKDQGGRRYKECKFLNYEHFPIKVQNDPKYLV